MLSRPVTQHSVSPDTGWLTGDTLVVELPGNMQVAVYSMMLSSPAATQFYFQDGGGNLLSSMISLAANQPLVLPQNANGEPWFLTTPTTSLHVYVTSGGPLYGDVFWLPQQGNPGEISILNKPWNLLATTSLEGPGTTTAIDTSRADLLIAVVSGTAPMLPPTDSASNTWVLTQLAAPNMAIYYVSQPTVSTGHTFTSTVTLPGLGILAFEGSAPVSPLDQVARGTTATLSVVTAQNNELLLAACYPSSGNNANISAPFTTRIRFMTTIPAIGLVAATLMQETFGPVSATFTGAAGNINQLVSFKGAVS